MSSYNQVNGIYANENQHLLQEILRKEWGFDGIVVTDWGGSNDHVKGVKAGSNLEMPAPGLDSARQIAAAVEEGSLTREELDTCVDQLLDAVLELRENSKIKRESFEQKEHHCLARKAAAESAVLLKKRSYPAVEARLQGGSDWRFCKGAALPGCRFLSGESDIRGNH